MVPEAGLKLNWAREIDSDNVGDYFGLTKAVTEKLNVVWGHTVTDFDGTVWNVVDAVSDETSAPTMTNYAALGIGSIIRFPKLTTPTIYMKCASSSPAVVGDWYYNNFTVLT